MNSSSHNQINTPFLIKQASIEDLPICIRLLAAMFAENSEVYPVFDKELLEEGVKALIKGSNLLIIVNNSIGVGLLAMTIKQFPWSKEDFLSNELTYILPDFRSHNLEKRLLSLAEEYAKINQLPLIFQCISTEQVGLKHKLLKKRGFQELGFFMIKR
jgi:GNAT superfamily N-acetyltransferase